MYSVIFIALAFLGIALLIRVLFLDRNVELHTPFIIIVGVFLVMYIGAVFFMSSRMDVFSQEKLSVSGGDGSGKTYVVDEPVHEVDLTTGP
jgi:hypothetical protein